MLSFFSLVGFLLVLWKYYYCNIFSLIIIGLFSISCCVDMIKFFDRIL